MEHKTERKLTYHPRRWNALQRDRNEELQHECADIHVIH